MVMRGYPEDIVRKAPRVITEEEPPKVVEPKEVVRYVYVPQYMPSERISLDPNVAIIALAITLGAIGIIALAMAYKK